MQTSKNRGPVLALDFVGTPYCSKMLSTKMCAQAQLQKEARKHTKRIFYDYDDVFCIIIFGAVITKVFTMIMPEEDCSLHEPSGRPTEKSSTGSKDDQSYYESALAAKLAAEDAAEDDRVEDGNTPTPSPPP
eukprot:scaffold18983_cov88-Skeletonema_marinoi.AAC.1